MAQATITVEIAFATDPTATPTWTDVSAYVRADQPLTIRRGRQYERNQIEAGTASFVLDNRDRRFDPSNASGPYWPNVRPVRRVRISATWSGTTYRLFSGYVETWPPTTQGRDATMPLRCVDAFKLFQSLALPRQTLLSAWGLLTAGSQGLGVVSGLTGARILSVQGNLASCTGIVTITGADLSGTVVVETIGLTGTSESFGTQRLTSITGVNVPAATVAGETVTLAATGRIRSGYSNGAIDEVLNAVGWGSERVVNAGQTFVPAVTLSDTTTILSHLQRIADGENGLFFMDGAGNATFHNRHLRLTQSDSVTSCGTFGDLVTDAYTYESIQLSYDDALIANDITVTRDGGLPQNTRDVTSQTRYFARVLQKSVMLITDDNEALAAAQWLLAAYKEPAVRVASITLAGQLNDNLWPQMLDREISDRITVRNRPPGGGALITQDGYIESISHTIQRGAWRTTWQLSPAANSLWFILDSSAAGLLDTNLLAY